MELNAILSHQMESQKRPLLEASVITLRHIHGCLRELYVLGRLSLFPKCLSESVCLNASTHPYVCPWV